MAKLVIQRETALQKFLKLPQLVTAAIALVTIFVSVIGGWTAQSYRVAQLESQVQDLKRGASDPAVLQAEIKALSDKIDAEMQGILRELSLIEKKLP